MSELTLRRALREAIAQLDAARVNSPALTARLLLARAIGQSKEWLIAHDTDALRDDAAHDFHTLLLRAISREPLAYILGQREFFGLDIVVDSRVLIPRPETELLVELALHELKEDFQPPITNLQSLIVNRQSQIFNCLDIGTGSGAVAIAIAKHAPRARVMATDISSDALAVARLNAQRHGVAERITFAQTDLLDGVAELPRVITANLPYVTREEIEGLPPEIQAHEPRVALDGGEDGLALVRRLLQQIAMRPAGVLRATFLEIGASQGQAALAASRETLPHARAEIKQDLAKLDRVLSLRFSHD